MKGIVLIEPGARYTTFPPIGLMHLAAVLRKKYNIIIKDYFNNLDSYNDRICFWPWYQATVTWNGYVNPCCVFCDNEIVWGNAFNEPFMKIWNNEKAKEFRKKIVNERKGICSSCCVDETFILEKLKPFYKIPLINLFSHRKIRPQNSLQNKNSDGSQKSGEFLI